MTGVYPYLTLLESGFLIPGHFHTSTTTGKSDQGSVVARSLVRLATDPYLLFPVQVPLSFIDLNSDKTSNEAMFE